MWKPVEADRQRVWNAGADTTGYLAFCRHGGTSCHTHHYTLTSITSDTAATGTWFIFSQGRAIQPANHLYLIDSLAQK